MKIVLDTCVIYPTVMREMLLGVARLGHFTPLWSARILEEDDPRPSLAVSADDAWLVTGGGHGELLLWRNDDSGSSLVEALLPPAPRSYFHTDLAFSPSGTRVMATGGWHTHGRLWIYELRR